MPVPANIAALSTTAGANSPPGSESVNTVDDYIRAHAAFIAQLRDEKAADAVTVKTTGAQTIDGSKTFNAVILGTALNCSRSVTGAGLATGGGVLNADRQITVPIADSFEAAEGTDNTVALTPLGLRQGLQASGAAPVFGVRCWVTFDGTRDTTGALSSANTNRQILANGNVSSVARLSAGRYQVNFTTNLQDTFYCTTASLSDRTFRHGILTQFTSHCIVETTNSGGTFADTGYVTLMIVR